VMSYHYLQQTVVPCWPCLWSSMYILPGHLYQPLELSVQRK
jgi:hypothetical protein